MQGLRPFSRVFDFAGRSGRAEFWQFHAILWSLMGVALFIEAAVGDSIGIITGLIGLVFALPQISVCVRRLHDTNNPGWLLALQATLIVTCIVSIASAETEKDVMRNSVFLVILAGATFYLAVKPGDEGENKYGHPDGEEMAELHEPRYPMGEPAAVWTPPTLTSSSDDTMARIERLGNLRERGLLSEEEFLSQKAAILAQG
ncbi:MAG: DUF805 domain-containing protein [Sphingobium sp.]